jgi:hypothetical protein
MVKRGSIEPFPPNGPFTITAEGTIHTISHLEEQLGQRGLEQLKIGGSAHALSLSNANAAQPQRSRESEGG